MIRDGGVKRALAGTGVNPTSATVDYVGTFDGTNDYVNCGAPLIPASGDFDLSFDVYFDSVGSDRYLMGFFNTAAGNNAAFYITYRTGSVRINALGQLMSSIVPAATTWTNIRVVRSGTTITTYKDGVQADQVTGQSGTFTQAENFHLGNVAIDGAAGSTYLQGRMDNFNLDGVTSYNFNEGSGATLNDNTGSNNGTITNAVTAAGSGFWANTR